MKAKKLVTATGLVTVLVACLACWHLKADDKPGVKPSAENTGAALSRAVPGVSTGSKSATNFGAAIFSPGAVGIYGVVTGFQGSPLFIITNSPSAPGVLWLARTNLFPNWATNSLSTNQFWTTDHTPPRPGIYEASPYTAIVVIPGPHPDDRCILRGDSNGPGISMPSFEPELRLIPRPPR